MDHWVGAPERTHAQEAFRALVLHAADIAEAQLVQHPD